MTEAISCAVKAGAICILNWRLLRAPIQSKRVSVYQRNFLGALVGDGRPLLMLTGLSLVLCGGFALFLSCTGRFLPQDVQFLGMTADGLCGLDQCRIVHFMFHDRVAFGGSLIAIGSLYMWLAEFPLRAGEAWAWWLFLLSGTAGFASFLTYLGYGYLDTWHGMATLLLLPCFVTGLWLQYARLLPPRSFASLFVPHEFVARPHPSPPHEPLAPPLPGPLPHFVAERENPSTLSWKSRYGLGRICLLFVAAGMMGGGLTIMGFGMTRVFVPQDIAYLGLKPEQLFAINPRLVPLIAHDRAGFGGGVCSCGIIIGFVAWCGRPCRSLWQALLVAGTVGFGTAIGIHPIIGYVDPVHLAPAVIGVLVFIAGMALLKKPMFKEITKYPNAHTQTPKYPSTQTPKETPSTNAKSRKDATKSGLTADGRG